MSEDGADETMEGWSIVRHRHRDDLGSDADSVEVISEDSDRDTDREAGDEGKDDLESNEGDKSVPSADPDSTTAEPEDQLETSEDSSGQSDDLRNQLADLDPLGDLTATLSSKLHHLLQTSSGSGLSREELRLRYVIIASALLALICSLLVSSYLLFMKLNHITSDSQNDRVSTQALQELDQVVSKLQTVLRLENEQHLREILSKMPADSLTLERLIPMADHLPRRMPADEDPKIVVSSKEAVGAEIVQNGDSTGGERVLKEGKLRNSRTSTISDQRDGVRSYSKESQRYPSKTDAIVQNEPKLENDLLLNDKQTDKPQEFNSSGSANPATTLNSAANSSTGIHLNEIPPPNDTLPNQAPPLDLLRSIRQDIVSIQKDVYSQIMNSLLEYKIDLYKNLLRADLDIMPEHSNKKVNHKNFMLMRSLQQIIARSSESNFESWYKFYSYSVFPKVRDVLSKIDSISKGSEQFKFEPKRENFEKVKENNFNDDFFVRAGDLHVDPVETVKGGFDWKNLDKKIRESMRNALKYGRPKSSHLPGYVEKDKRGDEGKRNFVVIGQDFVSARGEHDKSNLKGDFRKRKVDEHEREKHVREPEHKTQNGQENDQKGSGKSNDKHEHYKHKENDEKDHKPGEYGEKKRKHRYEKSKRDDRDKKSKHEDGHEKHKKHDEKHSHKHDKHDARYSHDNDAKYNDRKKAESKHDGDRDHGGRKDKHKNKNGDYKKDYSEKDFRGQYREKRSRRKISFSDVGKYMKNTVNGLWKTVKGGFKHVKEYSKNYIKEWRSRKPRDTGKYEEWRNEFVKEMKDVIRVLGGNPTLMSLSEVPKSVSRFLGDGLGSLMASSGDDKGEMGPEGLRPGPEGVKEDTCFDDDVCEEEEVSDDQGSDGQGYQPLYTDEGSPGHTSEGHSADEGYASEGYEAPYSDAPNHRGTEPAGSKTTSWYYDSAKHRAEARRRPNYPRVSDSSWFLGLGRHRAYLRRRGIHLDDDGSWFISSARHRAKMRQKHLESPNSPHFYSQASSRR